jgi:hypothetical protein
MYFYTISIDSDANIGEFGGGIINSAFDFFFTCRNPSLPVNCSVTFFEFCLCFDFLSIHCCTFHTIIYANINDENYDLQNLLFSPHILFL